MVERRAVAVIEFVERFEHAQDRRRRGEHERGIDRLDGVEEGRCRESARGAHVHVGHGRGKTHRRAVQRKRSERSDERIVGGNVVLLDQGADLRIDAGRAIPHPLRWAGRS